MSKPTLSANQRSKRTFWQRKISLFQHSKTASAAQFCRDEALSYQSFKAWQKKLDVQKTNEQPTQADFVRLQVPLQPTRDPNLMRCRFPDGLELAWDILMPPEAVVALIQEVRQR